MTSTPCTVIIANPLLSLFRSQIANPRFSVGFLIANLSPIAKPLLSLIRAQIANPRFSMVLWSANLITIDNLYPIASLQYFLSGNHIANPIADY